MDSQNTKLEIQSAWVWIFSSLIMLIYGSLGLMVFDLPGAEELTGYIQSIPTLYLIIAAFIIICIEGIYGVGSIFPGSSFAILLAAVAGLESIEQLIIILISIFLGWSLASVINIYSVKYLRKSPNSHINETSTSTKTHAWYTWFPPFCASHEVAETVRGMNPTSILLASMSVKFVATILMGIAAYFVPLMFDIENIESSDGFTGVIIVALLILGIGISKYRNIQKKAPLD
jgi:hypothetical protein